METTIGLFFLMSILAIIASVVFMFLIFYPLGKLQRKIGPRLLKV